MRWLMGLGGLLLLLGCQFFTFEDDIVLDDGDADEKSPVPTYVDLVATYDAIWDECSYTEYYKSVTITNEGTEDAPPFRIALNNDGNIVEVDGLAAGESITYEVANTMSLYVRADSDNIIEEPDEDNNFLTRFSGTSARPCYTPTPT